MTETTPESTPIVLRSDRLAVEIARPGSAYGGTRFDWTAFITQVTLDGVHTFCVPESLTPGQGTGGIGLCNEFGIERPVGYDDAQPGESFPKLGIGLLVRADDEPYTFMRPYEFVLRFPVDIDVTPEGARFFVGPVDSRGYAVRLEKNVSVRANELTVAYRLENVGSKPVITHEYCHNFCGIDGHAMGPEYRLRFAQPVVFQDMSEIYARRMPRRGGPPRGAMGQLTPAQIQARMLGVLEKEGNTLWPRETPERPFYCRLTGLAQTDDPQWELVHLPSGLAMREYDDFCPSRIAVWGTEHVVSAEVFVDIDLQPGETQIWTRRYAFLTGVS